jgi:hypothetical protein
MATGTIQITNKAGFNGEIPYVGQKNSLFSGATTGVNKVNNQGNALFGGQIVTTPLSIGKRSTNLTKPPIMVEPLNRTIPLVNATKTPNSTKPLVATSPNITQPRNATIPQNATTSQNLNASLNVTKRENITNTMNVTTTQNSTTL